MSVNLFRLHEFNALKDDMLNSHKKTIFETLGRNPIHPFPARMAPGIALEALGNGLKSLTVLDPMAGSGTVLAVAKSNGHKAYGVDVDPLAVLMASVWTRSINPNEIKNKASKVLDRAKRIFRDVSVGSAYPASSDDETKKFIRYWFDPYARRQLASLASAIGRVRDRTTRNVLWCGFSRLIISKSAGASRAMDLSHSRPHRVFQTAPIKPFAKFLKAVETVVANCPHLDDDKRDLESSVKLGDARSLLFKDKSIDLVLTSPPYLNAIDYMRCSKFSLVWMGYKIQELRRIRGGSIGTESTSGDNLDQAWIDSVIYKLGLNPPLSARDNSILSRYIVDMGNSLSEVSRVLKKNGRAVYVVGDSTLRGTFVSNSAIVIAVAEKHGLKLKDRHVRDLPENRRYLPPPKDRKKPGAMDSRMRKEVVLVFNKSA